MPGVCEHTHPQLNAGQAGYKAGVTRSECFGYGETQETVVEVSEIQFTDAGSVIQHHAHYFLSVCNIGFRIGVHHHSSICFLRYPGRKCRKARASGC